MNVSSQPSGLIPDQLLNNIKKGDCVLFLSAALPLGYANAPLSRTELAQALAAKYYLLPDRSWPEMIVLNDNAALIRSSNDPIRISKLKQELAHGGGSCI
jgi:hypothetical protein